MSKNSGEEEPSGSKLATSRGELPSANTDRVGGAGETIQELDNPASGDGGDLGSGMVVEEQMLINEAREDVACNLALVSAEEASVAAAQMVVSEGESAP